MAVPTADTTTSRRTGVQPTSTAAPVLTVIEPEALAPLGRLQDWLLEAGAVLCMVQPWRGDLLPSLSEVGDGLVVLGGAMSAHDDAQHPWLGDLRALLRQCVDAELPTVAICLGAQVAAEALGGRTAVPSPHGSEGGIVELQLTRDVADDPMLGEVVEAGLRAAALAGVPTREGTRLPVIVSHDDAVVRLPPQATLLASSEASPVQAWRAGSLLALQHHPESTPARVEYWRVRAALRHLGLATAAAADQALPDGAVPAEAMAAGARARAEAERVEPVIRAFGRTLAHVLVRTARAGGSRSA